MSTLVTGGAGYIGSHTVAELIAHGEQVVVVDNLSQGHRWAVQNCPLFEVDIQETAQLKEIMTRHRVDTVVHFAASSLVGESVQNPLKYYENNVVGTQRLLTAMLESDVLRIVFSSTASTYGEPQRTPIIETDQTVPTNPYGETKLAIERMLRWCHEAYGFQSISLRYFNAAGAHPTLPIGENHNPETHLIPIVLQVALGQRPFVSVYGNDYPTPDGTCIRDYIHVMDLASAHRLAVERLRSGTGNHEVFNLGIGKGFSVREVIEVSRTVTGRAIPSQDAVRRVGDPAVLVASSDRAQNMLGWRPLHTSLDSMVGSAWKWLTRS